MSLTTSEDVLINRAVQGDRMAFASIYDRYVERVYTHVYYRVSNKTDAEDITQEVFIKAWKAIKKYKSTGVPLVAWLLAITRNLVADYYRANKKKVSLEEMEFSGKIVLTAREDPEALTETSLKQSYIRNVLSKLKGDKQKVILMRFIDGFSYKETAEALSKSEGAVRVIQHRALNDMKRMLSKSE